MSLRGQHILSVKQFNQDNISALFSLAKKMPQIKANRQQPCKVLDGYVLGNIFFEPSTRSRMSFSSAFMYLGGQVNSTSSMTFSSMAKGESLVDSLSVIPMYCDVVVLRHAVQGSIAEASQYSCVPVINAGDGPGEHPTQALLDLYTILEEKETLNNLTIAFVGDLKFGRTIHSLARLLAMYDNISLIFSAPQIVQLPYTIVQELSEKSVKVVVTEDFDAAVSEADVIYSTRIQRERFESASDYASIENNYVLDKKKVMDIAKKEVTIMHPLPRTNEIAIDVDELPNAAYFRQAQNGLFVRMALFLSILGKENDI